ncbi:hypothetical protein [Streptomyces sp. SM12]|uniref:hypothetical protein n=1 Tax=Streptomyces sp. SM12 TaxID=1071602 RepID=UPI000CD55F64|nr:hypothetical protein [Streptomyces sp. SM12]
MSWYEIGYACGHSGRTQLYGARASRELQAEKRAGGDCGECYRRKLDEEKERRSREAAEENRAAGLPEMEGSPAQVKWAETIRAGYIGELTRARDRIQGSLAGGRWDSPRRAKLEERVAEIGVALDALAGITHVRWFIDNRELGVGRLLDLVERGDLRPRTEEEKEKGGVDPLNLNYLHFPAEEVAGTTSDNRFIVLRLVNSRWEGCTVQHSLKVTEKQPDGSVTIRFRGDWRFDISDGARVGVVRAEVFYEDRTNRLPEPRGRVYWAPPPFRAERRYGNEVDVPEADVREEDGFRGPVAVVHMTCSRWEGLHFRHPAGMVRRHRPGYVTILFRSDWEFKLRGGARLVRISAAALHQDRTEPLEEPGESLAVEPKRWYRVPFHPSRVRTGGRTGDPFVRLPPVGDDVADGLVFHAKRLCREEDGYLTWSFHEDWTFRVRTPEGAIVTLSAEEFVEATRDWAGSAPLPGVYVRVPQTLAPPEVEIPDDLLEDDPDITADDA